MFYLLLAAISLISFAILLAGLLAFIRNRQDARNRWFFVFTAFLAAWTTVNYLDSNTNVSFLNLLLQLDYIFALVMLWAFLNFGLVLFQSAKVKYGDFAFLRRMNLLFIPVTVLLIVLIFAGQLFDTTQVNGELQVHYTGLFNLYLALLSTYFLLSVFVLLYKRVHLLGTDRKAIDVILGGLFVAFVTNILTNVVFPEMNISVSAVKTLNLLGYAGIGFLALAIFLAITKQKLFDIRLVVARAVAYSLSVAVLAGFYAIVVLAGVTLFFDVNIPLNLLLFLAIATAVLGLSFQPLRSLFDRATTQIFYQDAYVPQHLLNRLNSALVSTIDLEKIAVQSVKILSSEIKSDNVRIAIRRVSQNGLFTLYDSSTHKKTDKELQQLHIAVEKTKATVISFDEIDPLNVELKELFAQNDIALLVVLRPTINEHKDNIGYILMGAKRSGNPYEMRDIQVMETVANEMILAIQNALHFEEIQNFNVTLQAKVDDATRKYRTANDKLKKLDETKDEFISMASHQLRTPLTSVKGYLSMVLEGDAGKLNKQQEELLKQSFLSSERMVNLIADLLNLSRLNTGKFVIDAAPTDLREVVDGEIAQLREAAKAKDIELTYKAPTEFPKVMLDSTKIHQVVMNFMDNALYYTPAGGKVEVALNETPSSVEYLVKDNGIGVPRQLQRHLFSKFYRADNARRMRPDGTGLGLYMAQKVILAQGGSIIFESEEGKGSTFGFRFNKNVQPPSVSTLPAAR